jgi:TRAP-type C4-dicarboxylate transport system permease small subunit
MILVTLLAVANVLMRAIFNKPIFGTFEGVCYLAMLMALLAMPGNELDDGNVKVTMVTDLLPATLQKIVAIFIDLLVIVGSSVIAVKLVEFAQQKMIDGDYSADLRIPTYIFVACISAGFALIVICTVYKLCKEIFGKSLSNEDKKSDNTMLG